ncbi:unnamed protein product [Candidula unifasciata]|uniref:Ammonium transporter n=1 Tax=Candidula unifasciata TaxID=100452 RepID=A0A8S3Z7S4_9EUPU|nr:unnamed protein product [Candidula unifasciata]
MQDNTTPSTYTNNTTMSSSPVTMAFDHAPKRSMFEARDAASWDDATWILTSSFIIFTMQSGFGLLESGSVSSKNEVNIMAKNVADVIFGGISYWMLGYGFSFGDGSGTNGFCGIGKFFIDPEDSVMGEEFSRFVFQSSFATTATTIVSGAIAERTRYLAYIVFSFFNTFVFCFPAHWVWSKHGWLNKLGVVDVAGDGPVHLVGGATSLIATIIIKPRAKRFTPEDDHQMGSPTGALLGLFILWWGWLAFNCGSTYGISGGKWKMAARAAATTLMAASTGGVAGFGCSYIVNNRKFHIPQIINGVLGGLVSITASCAVTGIWESLVIGAIGGVLVMASDALLVKLHIDDPVSAIPVHGVGGIWGLIAAGLFTHKDNITQNFSRTHGLVKGGGFYLLGVQMLAVVVITAWSMAASGLVLVILDKTMGLRLTPEEEEIGSDFIEHNIRSLNARCKSEIMSSAIAELETNGTVLNTNGEFILRIDPNLMANSTPGIEDSATNGNTIHPVLETRPGEREQSQPKSKLHFLIIRNRSSDAKSTNDKVKNPKRDSQKQDSACNISGVSMLSYSPQKDNLTNHSCDID